MEERMQKTSAQANDYPRKDRTESEVYEGVQTFMWMTEDNIVLFSSCVTQIAFDPIFDQLEELSLLVIHAKHHLSWLCVAGLGVG